MTKYSEKFKLSIIKRILPPNNESVVLISKETGIPEQTLYVWKRKAKEKGISITGEVTNSEKWSTQDKFHIVLEAATLSETELGEYCRKKGLYVEQVNAWKDACMQANGGVAQQATDLQKQLKEKDKELNKLSKELKRKESALAEAAALLILRKKANAIWGEDEDE